MLHFKTLSISVVSYIKYICVGVNLHLIHVCFQLIIPVFAGMRASICLNLDSIKLLVVLDGSGPLHPRPLPAHASLSCLVGQRDILEKWLIKNV